MKNKKGMSLIALVIGMLIMSILSGIVIINVNNSTDTARKTAFADELKTILDSVNEYYLIKGNYPVSETLTREEVLAMTTSSQYRSVLEQEMSLNNDSDTVYYIVNLDLLKVFGGFTESNGSAAYVINSEATNIYYPQGMTISDEIYFSLTNRLIGINNSGVSTNINMEPTSLTNTTDSIIVVKDKEELTNNMTINVTTTLNQEKLYYMIGEAETEIATDAPYQVVLSGDTLSSKQISALSIEPVVYFTKKDSAGNITARTNISINNLDLEAPVFTSFPVVEAYDKYNLVKFIGIVQDENDVERSFYVTNGQNVTAKEIVACGIQGEATHIKLDKTIPKIQMVVVDKASNISEVITVEIPAEYIN